MKQGTKAKVRCHEIPGEASSLKPQATALLLNIILEMRNLRKK